MSIVERALGRVREPDTVPAPEDGAAPLSSTAGAEAAALESLVTGVAPARTLKMRADETEAVGALWAGKVESALANQFRGIRRELFARVDARAKSGQSPIMLVTSPLPGDGKTFVSIGTARTLAGTPDYNIVLHDFDLIRRTTSGMFGAEELPGVTECLSERAELRRVLCATELPRLGLVPAGNGHDDAREILLGPRLGQFIARLRTTGPRTIHLLDTPPILSVVETAVLAEQVDVVILVVRSAQTPAQAVTDALEKLGAKSQVCVVLNGISRSSAADYGDYAEYGPVRR